MRRLLFLCCLAGLFGGAVEARQRAQGYCQQGGQAVVVSGITGKPAVQASYPNCTVKVFFSGLSGPVSISTLTRSSNVVTVVMSAPITNLSLNALAVIVGASDSSFNGSFTVTSVTQAANTFTFNQTGTDGSTAGGTATFTPSLFSDNAGTSLSNPFTASSVGLWFFYTENSRYDIQLSGGGIVSPFTIGDVLVSDPAGSTTPFVGVPVPPCTSVQTAVNILTGDFYSCIGGVFIKVGPGGNPGVLVSPVITPNPLNLDVNIGFKGPNPYVDGTRFGMRAVNQNVAPAIPGITVNCTSGSPNVTISSASTFQNGDGVALYGCGPGTVAVPAAPTVTPSVLVAQTGLLLDQPGPTGATTYCYQLVARTLMGATNVSPETCTNTGPASLGLQTINITSVSLSNNVATYTTSAPHGLVQYGHVVISGVTTSVSLNAQSTPVPFNGWFMVATVPDNTHFTVNLLSDTRNGAISAGTGGIVNYWNSIHIKATETTNNYIYYIYGRVSGGTKTLIGAMWPQDANLGAVRLTEITYLAFDDLGSPVTTFTNPPFYIPTTVPTTPTNSMLATTIVSGAGTTSLVLANNAGNSNSGQTILFDDAVTFLKAATAAANFGAGTAGPLMIPMDGGNNYFVFNSPISIGLGPTNQLIVQQKGTVWLNEPITTSNIIWEGQPSSGDLAAAFTTIITPPLYISRASPGFFINTNTIFSNLLMSLVSASTIVNGQIGLIQEQGGVPYSGAFRKVTFVLGSGGPTYSNMAAVFRANGAAADGWHFDDLTILGNQNGTIVGTTPAMYFDVNSNTTFTSKLTLGGVGAAAIRPYPAGGWLVADTIYSQGGYMPYFSLVRHPVYDPATFFAATIRQIGFDTTSVPLIANYGAHNLTLDAVNSGGGTAVIGSLTASTSTSSNHILNGNQSVTPANMGTSYINESYFVGDGVFGRSPLSTDIHYKNITIGPGNSLFTLAGPGAPPTCPVSAGGSVPVGANYYFLAPIHANGSEGTLSTYCLATTTGGNQTVILNWAAIPGVTQYNLYRGSDTGSHQTLLNGSPITGISYTDTAVSTSGASPTQMAAGGPAGMRGGLIWGTTAKLGGTTTTTLDSTVLTAATSAAVGGDSPFNSSPRGTLTAFLPGALTSTWTAATWTLTKPITVMSGTVQVKTAPVGCSPNAVVRITDGVTFTDITITALSNSFGSLPFWGAPNTLTVTVQTAAAGCGTSPPDANFLMAYR